MATSMTSFSFPVRVSATWAAAGGVRRRRRISPQAGHALEILGHAIEYLADEYVHQAGPCPPPIPVSKPFSFSWP